MRAKDSVSYVFLAVVWGASFLAMLRGVEACGGVGGVTFRCFIAAATLIVVALATGRRLKLGANWRAFAVVGATTVAGQLIGLAFGLPLIGTALSAILVAAIPLFSMLIARLWGIEMLTGRHIAGLVLGLAGLFLLVGFLVVLFF